MKISIIIPTVKKGAVTVKSLEHCPVPYQLILSREFGLGYARNYGAGQAECDLLVFLDDDLILKQEIWEKILTTHKGEFRMTKYSDFPCTRVMAIHAEDFWKEGGFDESIKFIAEDLVFYIEAIQHGLRFSEIPIEFVIHEHHEPRVHNKRIALSMIVESCRLFAKYGFRYSSLTGFFSHSFIKPMHLRSFLIRLLAFTYHALRVMSTGSARALFCYMRTLNLCFHAEKPAIV